MKFLSSIVQTRITTPLGDMVLAATHLGLAGTWFTDQRHLPEALDFKSIPHSWPRNDRHPVLLQTKQQLAEYFAGQRQTFDLPFDLSGGTAFQQAVWRVLLTISFGKSIAYGDVARHIGNPAAVRAVGAAVGRNPIGIIVPCHRVIGANGALTGYAGGLHRKVALLKLEGTASAKEFQLN